jgi:hypothetical protein
MQIMFSRMHSLKESPMALIGILGTTQLSTMQRTNLSIGAVKAAAVLILGKP